MKLKPLLCFAALLLVGVLAFEAFIYIRDNRAGNFNSGISIYVYPGMNSGNVFEQIDTQTVIRHPRALKRVFAKKEVDRYIKPGFYEIKSSTSSVQLARMLNNGWQSPVRLVIGGTLRKKDEIARKIASQLLLSDEEMLAAFDDSELLDSYGFTPVNVFSLFIPDTYSCFWTASVKDVLDIQKKAYDSFWNAERVAKAAKLGFTKEQVSILASIVKGETNYEPEMPKIAGVYENRLKKGMLLQADPTVAYCFDYNVNRILLKHLKVDSPYNTYKNKGLPPGPIYVPTRACLDAVLNPDCGYPEGSAAAKSGMPGQNGGNIYFCANPDFSLTHVFARSLAEHSRNASAFHRALKERKRGQ